MSERAVVLAVAFALLVGCGKKDQATAPAGATSTKPKTPDRLAPGELGPGKVNVFGFIAPSQLELEARFPDAAHFKGSVAPESLANYVRERVQADHVEIGAARTVFPKAKIKGGAADKIYRFEVIKDRDGTKLVIKDVTPPPMVEGLSEEERWRRAGMTPQGQPLDPKKLQ